MCRMVRAVREVMRCRDEVPTLIVQFFNALNPDTGFDNLSWIGHD